jgi:hypothetical protein
VLMLALGHLDSLLAIVLGQAAVGLFALLIWKGSGMFWYGTGYFFIGGYRLCKSMLSALMRPMVHPAQLGLAFGFLETINAVTIILAPLLAGILYQQNPSSIFPVSIGLIAATLLASLFIWHRKNTRLEPVMQPSENHLN